MTCGLLQADIKVLAGYDINEDCRYAYEVNNKVPFYNIDLMKVENDYLEKHFNGLGKEDKTYIHFSPPCQPYSTMTKKDSRLQHHPKYNIADKLFDIVLEIKPDFISIEEVVKVMKLDMFQARVDELREYYHIDQKVINIADYGAPQNRKRYFLIGKKKLPNVELFGMEFPR